MSQSYKFKSLEIAKSNEKEQASISQTDAFNVYEVGETRTIDFIMLDGTRQNFPYSHYLTSWLGKEDNQLVIKVFFATHLVTVKGYCLEKIYNYLLSLRLKSMKANNKRYENSNSNKPFVTHISINWKNEQNLI